MTKILIIDDEQIIRDRMAKLLQLDDYETVTAEDGLKGLEMLEQEKPDVALVDIKMPGMDGIEVLRKAKEKAFETEFIMITGHGGVETAIDALKIGAFGYIQKPVEYDELEIEIKRALEKQDMQKKLSEHVHTLESAHSELDQIFNSAADGMWVVDKDFKVLRTNQTFDLLSGFSTDEAVGEKCFEIFSDPSCHTPDCCVQRLLNGAKRVECEVEKERRDGSTISCLLTAVPFLSPSGELIGVLQNFKDMTEYHEAAQEINRAHDQLETLYQQLHREHEIAKQVFANVIRTDYIEFSHMKYLLCPMEIVGGDLILAASGLSGNQFIFLGDFTGHGLSAAIGAISVSDIFYTMVQKGHSLEKMIAEINKKLKKVLPTGLFLCACLVELDLSRGILSMWNGGLPDILIVNEGGVKSRLPSNHVPLGVVGNDSLDAGLEVLKVGKGDRVYIFTDGVEEATNTDGEMFGEKRLVECFSGNRDPETFFDAVCKSLDDFRSGGKQSDDIAIIELRCDPEALPRFDEKIIAPVEEVSKGYRLTVELGPNDLKANDLLPRLLEMLMGARRELQDQQQNIYLILAELVTNALDYGVMELDSKLKRGAEGFEKYFAIREKALSELNDGWVKLDFALFAQDKGGKLVMRVEDSGPGFDYAAELPEAFDDASFSGRGILLVKSLCLDFSFQGNGSQAEAVYVWSE
ncbi:MAG: SpoIIE family protein phosphatase [Desulfobacterales bacterium]